MLRRLQPIKSVDQIDEEVQTMSKKSSSDRMSDDLIELIVSYLSFEDKLRFECLSKRFQRLVFSKQYSLDLNSVYEQLVIGYGLERHELLRAMEKIVVKLGNIKDLELPYVYHNYCQLMTTITLLCPKLTKLTFNKVVDCKGCWTDFFETFGPQLKTIDILCTDDNEVIQFFDKFAKKCNQLVEVNAWIGSMNSIGPGFHTQLSPKLKRIDQLVFGNDDINCFHVFVTNHKQLEQLFIICEENLIQSSFDELLESLAKLMKLKSLYITVPFFELKKLSLKAFESFPILNHLKRLSLDFEDDLISMDTFLEVSKLFNYRQFQCLTRFELYANEESSAFELMSSDWFRPLTRLTHLSITSIGDRFFANMASNVPNLQSLNIYFIRSISVMMCRSLKELPNLKDLTINGIKQ